MIALQLDWNHRLNIDRMALPNITPAMDGHNVKEAAKVAIRTFGNFSASVR